MELTAIKDKQYTSFLNQFPDHTRLWIYQSERKLTAAECEQLKMELNSFVERWASHSVNLMATGDVLMSAFIVLGVDESAKGASGCSIDSSVHFVKQLSHSLGVDFMNRMIFTYWQNDEVHFASREAFTQLYNAGKISDETIVFDTLVKNKESFVKSFTKKLADSWHARMI